MLQTSFRFDDDADFAGFDIEASGKKIADEIVPEKRSV